MPFEQKTGFACRAGPVFFSYFLLHFSLPAPLHFVHKFSQGLDFIRSQPTNLQNGHLRQIKTQRLFLAFAALHGIICGTLLLGIGSPGRLAVFPKFVFQALCILCGCALCALLHILPNPHFPCLAFVPRPCYVLFVRLVSLRPAAFAVRKICLHSLRSTFIYRCAHLPFYTQCR